MRSALGILLMLLIASPAMAQKQRPANEPIELAAVQQKSLPCLPIDPRPECQGKGAGIPPAPSGPPSCDFNTFTIITPQNVVQQLQACGQKLLADSQAALTSAKTANDNIAMACLTPGTALIQAAVGTPAVAATDTTPAIPAELPGPILIFQKFREFVNNGGITNCKAWVNNTVTAGAASGL